LPLQFTVDILEALKRNGFTTYRLRKERLLSESTIQKLRKKEPVSWENIETLCRLLNCNIGDIVEYIPDGEDSNE